MLRCQKHKRGLPVLYHVFAVLIISVFLAGQAHAAQEAVGDDGRTVRLNDDGRWVYITTDRFATTPEGKRVRLKQDGSWQYTGEISADETGAGRRVASDRKFLDDQSVELALADLVIETIRGKKSAAHKNSRKKTQSVFHLNITVAKDAAEAVTLSVQNSDFAIEDTDGRQYPVVRVKPAVVRVKPGAEATIIVRADGSPHWWTTKSMSLTLDKTLFARQKNIVLIRTMSSAKKKTVDVFE